MTRLVVGDDGGIVDRAEATVDADPGQELNRQTRSYMDSYPGLFCTEAFEHVMANPANRALVVEYASPSYQPKPIPLCGNSPAPKRHGEDVDRAVRHYMAQHNTTDYVEAMPEVLAANPALAKAYAGIDNAK